MTATGLYLEDLTVGDEITSATYRLEAEEIVEFGRRYDPQPFHTDPEAADESFFRGLAASGWHTASVTMRLVVESVPLAAGVIGAGAELEWPRPTRPGDTLRVVSTVQEILPSRSRPDRGIVVVECRTLNQDDELCQRMVTKLVVMRSPGSVEAPAES
ncbi:MaoC family dehydratase [Georgenia sp. Z1491]|uniref:MaoC family dehydratase n=1 Tax=Georgenia sp. Z1491 TaxID=3416707 RepID=UPI003CFA8407